MFGSGVPTAEKPQARRYFLMSYGPDARSENDLVWSNYKKYLENTSILVPFPPFLYQRLPKIVKQTILFDFGMYHFDEEVDGKAAIEEARIGAA
jgi:hypothetical protein